MINLVLFGPPGAGKGTQSEKLIKKYGFVHISTGDLFRWHTKNDTPLGKKVKEIMNSGALVPDEITIAMLKEELDKNPQAKGFLFDGGVLPKHHAAAEGRELEGLHAECSRAANGRGRAAMEDVANGNGAGEGRGR